jgi:hypothetical protein
MKFNEVYLDASAANVPTLMFKHSVETFGAMLDQFKPNYQKQLKALLQYDYDMYRIRTAKTNVAIQNVYQFDPADLEANLPIEEYKDRSCIIRLEKLNGNINRTVIPLR